MKTISSLFALVAVFLLISGCKDSDFLQEKMESNTSVNDFYKTPMECEVALTGVYAAISNGRLTNHDDFTRGLLMANAVGTDELAARHDWGDGDPNSMNRLGRLSFSPTSPSYLPGIWQVLYAGVNRANLLLDRIEAVSFEDVNQKKRIAAEAHFLRGFYLFYAAQLWGAVPVPLRSEKASWTLPRASVEEVYKQVETDFRQAYTDLGVSSNLLGRANRFTAAAFLTKLYVYLASCQQNKIGDWAILTDQGKNLLSFDWVDASATWKKADDLAREIYTSSGYQLIPEYKRLFYPTTKQDQYREFLLEAECEQVQAWYLPGDYLVAEGDWPTNGGSGAPMRPSTEMAMRYNPADLRFQHNIVRYIPAVNSGLLKLEKVGGKDFAIPRAFEKDTLDQISLGKMRHTMPYEYTIPAWAGVQNVPILRFAEVVLWYAETRYQLGDEAKARDLLKQIRLRAAGGDAQVADQLTAAYARPNFMQELMDERSRELVGEGQRRADLIRTGMYKTALFSINPDRETHGYFNESWKALQENYQDFKIWYPIMATEIAVNTNLVQNPGYSFK